VEQQTNKKMIVFEMDDTLLRGRFIEACADKFVFDEELAKLKSSDSDPAVVIKNVAKLFCGLSREQLLTVISRMTIIDESAKVIKELQRQGHIVGIISDSYQFAVDYIKDLLGADFGIGNRLDFTNGKATGEIAIPAYFYYQGEGECEHTYCKTNALIFTAKNYNIPVKNTVTIGSAASDLCIIKRSGLGIAFCTKDQQLRTEANKVIDKLSFAVLLNIDHLIKKEAGSARNN
jgi:glucosyl-3-phosphoglycerate synthase